MLPLARMPRADHALSPAQHHQSQHPSTALLRAHGHLHHYMQLRRQLKRQRRQLKRPRR
jgi:hypothetical protein